MGARFLDWMALNKAFVTGFVIGLVVGVALGILGGYFA